MNSLYFCLHNASLLRLSTPRVIGSVKAFKISTIDCVLDGTLRVADGVAVGSLGSAWLCGATVGHQAAFPAVIAWLPSSGHIA